MNHEYLTDRILFHLENSPRIQEQISRIALNMLDELKQNDPVKYAEIEEFFKAYN